MKKTILKSEKLGDTALSPSTLEQLLEENAQLKRELSGSKETIKWLTERHKDERDMLSERIKNLQAEISFQKSNEQSAALSKKRSGLYFSLGLAEQLKNSERTKQPTSLLRKK